MADETSMDETAGDEGGVVGKLVLLLALVAAVSYALKRKREQELDEALWEEPSSV